MYKKIYAVLLSCLLAIGLALPSFAGLSEAERAVVQNKVEAEYKTDTAELRALEKALADEDRYAVAERGGNAQEETLIHEYNLDAARRVYTSETLMLTAYEASQDIHAVFSEEYQWLVPINGNDEQVAVFLVKDGAAKFIGISPTNGYYISDEVLLKSLSESDIDLDSITSVKYLRAAMYHTTFAVVDTTGETYAVPFASNPDFSELENQKVYPANDMMQFLLETYDESKLSESPNSNGGVPLRNQTAPDGIPLRILHPILIATALALSLIVMGASVYALRKTSKNRKLQK